MRELKRSIARNMMKLRGVPQINKKKITDTSSGKNRKRSFFAMNWRKYLNYALEPRASFRR